MKRFISSLVLGVSLTVGAQNYADYMRQMSRTETDSLTSEVLEQTRQYSVYLPPRYATDTLRTYPVVYLLHGVNDTHRGWFERGHVKDVADRLIASGEIEPMIIITPNAWGETGWDGYFDVDGWNYEQFFFTEFIPEMERRYRIAPERSKRGIAGLSMGGGGATAYAQRHPDTFAACYAMSALMDFPGMPQASSKFADAVRSHSCIDYVNEANADSLRQVAWFVDCGDDDFLLDLNLDFYKAMRQARIPCQLRVRDGGHDWEYWHSALYQALPFLSRAFQARSRE